MMKNNLNIQIKNGVQLEQNIDRTSESVPLLSEPLKTEKKACIVLPTYNEADNIRIVLEKIFLVQGSIPGITLCVLVVDDNSPDGTASIVQEYQTKNSFVYLLVRKRKEGLGTAYKDGFKYAIKEIKPDVIMEMDADLSHDPDYIPSLLMAVQDGADFVIGSRYVAGGSLPEEWGIKRKMMSKMANLYARGILHLPQLDCTGGFRAMKSTIFEKINLNLLDAQGYIFQISLLHNVVASGFVVKEIPIHFYDRQRGKSKLSIKDILELLIKIPLLRKWVAKIETMR